MPMGKSPDIHRQTPDWVLKNHPNNRSPPGNGMSEFAAPGHNVPCAFESFILADGEKKVEMKLDTRMPNTSIFLFNKEDHTLANMLRARLLQNNHVMFSGYKVPHPLFPTFELRIQTDGEMTPKEALLSACKDLVNDLGILSREFSKEYELRKMVGPSGLGQNGH